uniref:Uncharacterized protein n=1 Tax=Trichogramma kaykai TaxID=54128 RepID=A0ABD2WHI7_9HYME
MLSKWWDMSRKNKETLKSLRKRVNWEIYEDRVKLLFQLEPIFYEWKDPLPNLREIFQGDEIDRLLTDSANLEDSEIGERFIVFVACSGYKDQPELDEDGDPVLQRTTALHHAARRKSENWWGLSRHLFRIFDRFDANYRDFFGCTHLHIACQLRCPELVGQFLDRGQNPDCLPCKFVDPPLHLIIRTGVRLCRLFEMLLLGGADPNLPDTEGRAPLHAICEKPYGAHRWVLDLIDFCRQYQKPLNFDARDALGRTALHVALIHDRRNLIEVLMLDTDMNLADADGLTPLHIICKNCPYSRDLYLRWLLELFKVNDLKRQRVLIDAQDKQGRTPLQWAVTNVWPGAVDLLLKRGADLSSFVFPSKICFGKGMASRNANFKLRLASGLMAIVESLENAGYELELSDALTIMESFFEHKVFEKSTSLVQRLHDDKKFEIEAKNKEIIQGLSLYDLIQLQPREVTKQFSFNDWFKNSEKFFNRVSIFYYEAFTAHLAEKLSRKFFLSWALVTFCELIHFRLPILCCDMMIENLPNEDLYNICLAATGQN